MINSFDSDKQTKWLQSVARFVGKIQVHFLIDVVHGIAVWFLELPSDYTSWRLTRLAGRLQVLLNIYSPIDGMVIHHRLPLPPQFA